MSEKFEEMLRSRIRNSVSNSDEKDLLKVVLGEIQRLSSAKTSEEQCYGVVKGIIKSNEENVMHLAKMYDDPNDDPRCGKYHKEIQLLQDLLPNYWNKEQIQQELNSAGIDLSQSKNDGQAIGMAMSHLKKIGAPVEGGTVKEVVAEMRAS